MRVFAEALGGGMSSRLFQEAREKLGLAYAVDAWSDAYADDGMVGIYAGAAAGTAGELARAAAGHGLALSDKIAPVELDRAKAQLKAHLFMAREAPLARAEQAAGQLLLFGRLFAPAEIAEGIDAVSAEDIRRLGGRLLQPRACAVAALGPKGRPARRRKLPAGPVQLERDLRSLIQGSGRADLNPTRL